jgi:hypothetical protein
MNDEPEIRSGLPPVERRLEAELAARRPVPAPGFRGALGRRLAADDPGYGPRPERLRPKVMGMLGGGVLLIVLGALQGIGAL